MADQASLLRRIACSSDAIADIEIRRGNSAPISEHDRMLEQKYREIAELVQGRIKTRPYVTLRWHKRIANKELIGAIAEFKVRAYSPVTLEVVLDASAVKKRRDGSPLNGGKMTCAYQFRTKNGVFLTTMFSPDENPVHALLSSIADGLWKNEITRFNGSTDIRGYTAYQKSKSRSEFSNRDEYRTVVAMTIPHVVLTYDWVIFDPTCETNNDRIAITYLREWGKYVV